jgi:hypothetical protein
VNPLVQLLLWVVLIASVVCMAFGYYPALIPALLWIYLGRYMWREPRRIFNHLLGLCVNDSTVGSVSAVNAGAPSGSVHSGFRCVRNIIRNGLSCGTP